jgi:hypothetical protein
MGFHRKLWIDGDEEEDDDDDDADGSVPDQGLDLLQNIYASHMI